MKDLNQGPPDFKSSVLNHSATLPPLDFCQFILSRVVCSLEHDLRSATWVKPQDTKARVEDEDVEESCAAQIPEGSSESGQDYAAVDVC